MDVAAAPAPIGSPCLDGDSSSLPDLQQSRSMFGDSDNDSSHPTPSDMTTAVQNSPRESWPATKMRADEEVRKIHYIDSPAQSLSAYVSLPSAAPTEQSAAANLPSTTVPAAASSTSKTQLPMHTKAPSTVSQPFSTLSASTSAPPAASTSAAVVAPGLVPAAESTTKAAEPSSLLPASTAPSSTASTPASTPGATPQTYARKRGRPRKHPLPDPNNPPPPKTKRKLSADTIAKKKAAAARSAASNATSLLSVPDLGRLIPQGSTSENAQGFIKNNLRLFADLFVALQKQASTDHSIRHEASEQLQDFTVEGSTQAAAAQELNLGDAATAKASEDLDSASNLPASLDISTLSTVQTEAGNDPLAAHTADPTSDLKANISAGSTDKVPGPSDAIRHEIRKKMADVTKGREAIHAEMLQMRVDASFFENAQKTVDERIVVLRDRIARNTAVLQREREATRKAREATRKAKKDRKAREKSLRDSEREERRLAQTFAQLEREIAAEEEERRRLEEAESSDEEQGEATEAMQVDSGADMDSSGLVMSPSEATSASMSASATPSISTGTPTAPDRALGFSDEELAKVLGISTSELAGFSQTLELTSLQPALASTDISTTGAESTSASAFASILAPTQSTDTLDVGSSDNATDGFDVAAFLEMATSFGGAAAGSQDSAPTQQNDSASSLN